MKTTSDPYEKTPEPSVRDYLSAVERETITLPAERRQELLADLAEHIEVTLAERPTTEVREVLAGLGDPRTIAATALAEAGTAAAPGDWEARAAAVPRGKVHPLVPLILLCLTNPLTLLSDAVPSDMAAALVSICGALVRIVGAVLLCTSVHWSRSYKTAGVLLGAVLPTVAALTWNALNGAIAAIGNDGVEMETLLLPTLALAVIPVLTSLWLWRNRRGV
ncbi:hypothetical protein PUR49_06705 [Streptomyces sp. BE147]|uniref:HAAS signaling domain-containing protein n=1 Tax=Streptomyces sp. BE147 TaxID=3002524 RepID=UPI002E77134F|nr:hypothetical protein [Streptomyces sp. BE147]MEE1736196.1 hypothetical protein [Streptomyces sp. BE147]